MNDENVEAKLARWRPARAPSGLMRRLHAAAPPAPVAQPEQRRAGEWFAGGSWRLWPVAYAGLLTAWALILALRLLTPSEPVVIGRNDPEQDNVSAFADTLAAERTLLLARNTTDQP